LPFSKCILPPSSSLSVLKINPTLMPDQDAPPPPLMDEEVGFPPPRVSKTSPDLVNYRRCPLRSLSDPRSSHEPQAIHFIPTFPPVHVPARPGHRPFCPLPPRQLFFPTLSYQLLLRFQARTLRAASLKAISGVKAPLFSFKEWTLPDSPASPSAQHRTNFFGTPAATCNFSCDLLLVSLADTSFRPYCWARAVDGKSLFDLCPL